MLRALAPRGPPSVGLMMRTRPELVWRAQFVAHRLSRPSQRRTGLLAALCNFFAPSTYICRVQPRSAGNTPAISVCNALQPSSSECLYSKLPCSSSTLATFAVATPSLHRVLIPTT